MMRWGGRGMDLDFWRSLKATFEAGDLEKGEIFKMSGGRGGPETQGGDLPIHAEEAPRLSSLLKP